MPATLRREIVEGRFGSNASGFVEADPPRLSAAPQKMG
jgi:hypothetical protein